MLAVENINWDGLEPFKTREREEEYRGWINETVQVIVKKVQNEAKAKAEAEILRKLTHVNVIELISPIQKDRSWYLILEFCNKSLHEICDECYRNKASLPFPEASMLYQIANGLQYIHGQRMVHADLRPENVLLTVDYQAKISGFEFSRETTSEGFFSFDNDNLGHDSYLGPEILKNLHELEEKPFVSREKLPKLSTKIDVFSGGCTFFFLVTLGIHPFGATKYTIPYNISQRNQINFKKLQPEHFSFAMIQCMIRNNPSDRPSFDEVTSFLKDVLHNPNNPGVNWTKEWFKKVKPESLRMTCDISKKLGSTDRKSVGQVFAGTFDGDNIAVKRILSSDLKRGEPVVPYVDLQKLHHENVLKFLYVTKDEDFTYLGYELCAANLSDYYRDFYKGPVPTVIEAFQQMAKGLSYIHSKGFVHGSIRPTNVLISCTDHVHLKLSDFGIRPPDMITTTKSSGHGKYSKEFYHPPELLRNLNNSNKFIDSIDELCDIFSLGCVFYTYATKGDHPFHEKGTSIYFINPNIINGHVIMKGLDDDPVKRDIIVQMIQDNREKRISLIGLRNRLHIN